MRSGTALTQLVEFSDGPPDGNITWELLDGRGAQVATGSVTPAADSASAIIAVSTAQNTIEADALSSPRELQWSYTVAGLAQAGRYRYRLEAFLQLGVSEDGVRRKLGLETHELEDSAIDLVSAYSRFRELATPTSLTATETAGGYAALLACDAIEATAAITLIPALQVKLAAKQSSGTDQFQRAAIDWEAIREQLNRYVAEGLAAVNPLADVTSNFGALVVAVVRDDPVTATAG
jgi:hypothetical protein